ncbi:MAG: ATP-binding cassette domain-containing protein [Candidatus Omnitrophica bacterium]|nr:ATP-binding cassette domain-containing protein [Candidatus Omnitrophota bacterium]
MENKPVIEARDLTIGYGEEIVMRGLNFRVQKGDIFIIMGGSGCGKSTLLKSIIGLLEPLAGKVLYGEKSFWEAEAPEQLKIMRRFGVLYQGGALWSSLTLAENIALPLEMYTQLRPKQVQDVVELKLALVGLSGYEDFYPAEISGGMRKRAGLARAMALDPDILFFDEPSAGLDPLSAKLLDDLILQLSDTLGTTVVMVTHELASIFAVGNNAIFLDREAKTMTAEGPPKQLLKDSRDERVIEFLTRGEKPARRA